MAVNSDKMTRQLSAQHASGVSTLNFQNPTRKLIPGEWLTVSGNSTEYEVETSSTGTCTISPVLAALANDNTQITRFDKYAPMDFEDLLEELDLQKEKDDDLIVFIYKKALQCRFKLEKYLPSIVSRSYTEWHDVDYSGKDFIFLKHYPIQSISSVSIANGTSALSSTDYEYDAETGRVHAYGGWICGIREVKVVYTAGQTNVDPDIQELYAKFVRYNFEFNKRGKDRPYSVSESAAGSTIELSTPADIDEWLMAQLNEYRPILV